MPHLYTIPVHKDTHRCHPYLSDLLVIWALTGIALPLVNSGEILPDVGDVGLEGLFNISIHYEGYASGALTGELPALIEVQVHSGTIPTPQYENPVTISPPGAKPPLFRMVQAEFSLLAERAADWVETNVSTDRHNWPPVTNFCRVVRNAIAHGGTINIKSETAPKVHWRGIDYSNANYGLEIMRPNGQIGWGDLILLMCDLDAELDSLSAPIPLP